MSQMPIINQDLCNGCGLCTLVCDLGGLIILNNVVSIVDTEECDYCAECEAVCPTGAIRCPYEIIIEEHYEHLEITFEEYYNNG